MIKQLTDRQRKNVKRLHEFMQGGPITLLKHISIIEDEFEKMRASVKEPLNGQKGDKGDIGPRGKSGKDGRDGQDGRNGQDGKNGPTGMPGKDGKSVVGPKGKDGKDGKDGPPGRNATKLDISPQEIRDYLELLLDDERLDAKYIKGLPEAVAKGLNPPNGPMLHTPALSNLPDVSVVGVAIGQTLQWNGTYWQAASAGSTGSIIGATNSGDGQHYTLAQAPTTSAYYAIINNGMYTADDSAFGFSVSGTALTFNSPLPSDIASTIIKLVCI